ncbi:hypothetical protein F4775DRAFT_606183 [Biscogniauxia sp. FL1348]|nr:hypothetical protein F4775DRAFT_606183 [Biscogniauxia sp. FL1348]
MPRQFKRACDNTCRHRKLKCDEDYPICQRCAKTGRYCDRSERPLQIRITPGREHKGRDLSTKAPRKALELRETADLFHHYIVDVALWYDLSDAQSTFSTHVPAVSLDDPLLFTALMALSTMHMSKTAAPSSRDVAEAYHGQCIRLLIDLDASDPRIEKGIALAATCLLRSYEILDGEGDPNRHLRGAYSLASQYHSLPLQSSGGLPASGFWNYLREDITFSLFGHCRLKIDLDSIPGVTHFPSDSDHLNAISLVLGRIINALIETTASIAEATWEMLLNIVVTSFSELPKHFRPYSRGSVMQLSALPSVRMLRNCHAATQHYYLVSLTILAMRSSNTSQLEMVKNTVMEMGDMPTDAVTKEDVLEHLALEVCGIAFTSNEPAVLVNALGPMSFCARHIRHEPARREVTAHLSASKKATGWPIQQIIANLQNSWEARTTHGPATLT